MTDEAQPDGVENSQPDPEVVIEENTERQKDWELAEFFRRRGRKARWARVRSLTLFFATGFLICANLPRITDVGGWGGTVDAAAGTSAVLALAGAVAMLIFFAAARKTLTCPGCKKANTSLSGAPCVHCGLGTRDE